MGKYADHLDRIRAGGTVVLRPWWSFLPRSSNVRLEVRSDGFTYGRDGKSASCSFADVDRIDMDQFEMELVSPRDRVIRQSRTATTTLPCVHFSDGTRTNLVDLEQLGSVPHLVWLLNAVANPDDPTPEPNPLRAISKFRWVAGTFIVIFGAPFIWEYTRL